VFKNPDKNGNMHHGRALLNEYIVTQDRLNISQFPFLIDDAHGDEINPFPVQPIVLPSPSLLHESTNGSICEIMVKR
jgi:hypothetical protein